MKPVIVIGGPTAVGKTKHSIALATAIQGEIVNADSMQVYQEMNIGVAKVEMEEQQGVPHHLLDLVSVRDSFDVATYQEYARKIIKEIQGRGHIPIFVGGTGLYLKAALYDYEFQPLENQIPSFSYEGVESSELYRRLLEIDPDSSRTIHPNNRKRIIRALSIYETQGMTKSELIQKQQHVLCYPTLFIGLTMPREELYQRINDRVLLQIKNGLLEEAKTIYEIAATGSTALQAIGYKEWIPYFQGTSDINQVIMTIQQNTRRYAKRQYTWFSNQFPIHWIDVSTISEQEFVDTVKNLYQKMEGSYESNI